MHNMQQQVVDTENQTFKRVRKACIPCRNAKVGCDNQRPCTRCAKHGFESTCIDAVRKKRKSKKARVAEDATIATPSFDFAGSVSSEGDNNSPQLDFSAPPMTPMSYLHTLLQDDLPIDAGQFNSNPTVEYPQLASVTLPPPNLPTSPPKPNFNPLQQQQYWASHGSSHVVQLPSYLNPSENQTDEAFAMWDMASNYVLLDCSPKFATLLGYSTPKDMILCHGLIRFFDIVHPKLLPVVFDTCRDANEKQINSFDRPCAWVKKDGKMLHVFVNISRNGSLLRTRVQHVFPEAPIMVDRIPQPNTQSNNTVLLATLDTEGNGK